MSKKVALLIGVGEYGEGLKPLRCPANGVDAMQSVLLNPEIGGFDEVVALVNPDVGEMRSRMGEVFAGLTKDDLVLFYFTGHGIKDMNGKFYLSTKQTQLFVNGRINPGTAVEADFLRSVVGDSLASRKVVILDCCFGAAFADGFMGMDDSSVDVEAQLGSKEFDSRGWCVLTASTSTQYALEQDDEELSVYTRYLVAGLKTGGAAPDGHELISIGHLHEYVRGQVKEAAPAMEPAIFNAQQGAEIAIAKAIVDNIQRYRKQVQTKVRNGNIRPAARVYLLQWQQRLGLSADQATEIENEVLKPFRERQKNVDIYSDALQAEKATAYPLGADAIHDLKDLQRLLNLRDKDTQAVEKAILGSSIEVASDTNVQSKSKSSQEPLKVKEDPVPDPLFGFETVRVDDTGEVVERLPVQVKYFSQHLGDDIILDMVCIPSGQFLMGSEKGEEGGRIHEYPQKTITVSSFWMGTFTVTQLQWMAISKLNKVDRELSINPSHFQGKSRPVERVSWLDAVEFCKRLSRHSGREYRLPKESEWEYACRAGSKTPFSFGASITSDLVNCDGRGTYGQSVKGNSRQKTIEVGSFPPNSFGLHDMHGNVLEWCLDGWHNNYKNMPVDGSAWMASDEKKVLRGGSCIAYPRCCRSASRAYASLGSNSFNIGFRVCCGDSLVV